MILLHKNDILKIKNKWKLNKHFYVSDFSHQLFSYSYCKWISESIKYLVIFFMFKKHFKILASKKLLKSISLKHIIFVNQYNIWISKYNRIFKSWF